MQTKCNNPRRKAPRSSSGKRPEITPDETRKRLATVITQLMQACSLDYPWVGRIIGAARRRDWSTVYSITDSLPAVQSSAALSRVVCQLKALVLKYPFSYQEIGLQVTPKQRGLDVFWESEDRCRKTNRRLSSFSRISRTRYAKYIAYMKHDLEKLLGEEPRLDEVYARCGMSSGANLGVHGNATNLYRKLFCESWTVTACAEPYALSAICVNSQILAAIQRPRPTSLISLEVDPREWGVGIKRVACNKVSFVPKTAKVERPIAVEPLLNSFLQSGIDHVLRDKLRGWGIDLRSQKRNQELARLGSLDGSLATIDLKSASDSLSISLAKLVLPSAWFSLLNNARSPAFTLDGVEHRSEKFVSMGNGFCFPLETLLFTAALRAVRDIHQAADRRFAVYGDDIICSVSYARELIRLLAFMGFRTNVDKTFVEGPFRESCGTDWYLGQDIRPVYLKRHLSNTSDIMVFHNRTLKNEATASLFAETRLWLRELVEAKHRFVRPAPTYHTEEISGLYDQRNANGAFEVPTDVFMASAFAAWDRNQHRWSWREFVFLPVADTAAGDVTRFELAEYLSALQSGGERSLNLRYTAKRAIIAR